MLSRYHNSNSNSLTDQSGGRFLSQIFTDQNGQQFRMVFFVALVNGEVKGRLVSVEPISTSSVVKALTGDVANDFGSIPCLPISFDKKEIDTPVKSFYTPVVSPYTELIFFTSQPTRAPNFAYVSRV